jgi:tetratricopeptide (TPR) repeat protein
VQFSTATNVQFSAAVDSPAFIFRARQCSQCCCPDS